MNKNKVLLGDCREVLKTLPDNSVDSIVTDPPYELGFMGKKWDKSGIAYDLDVWKQCIRVLKPGGHLLAFGGTRTYHRMAVAIEDAGFEIRDMIEWVYGSGFPKSLNIGKAVDKLQGNERKAVETDKTIPDIRANNYSNSNGKERLKANITKGTSEWEGWGTALKPAHEPICMARKPLSEKTLAENCLKWGTGGINVDGSRVESSQEDKITMDNKASKNPTTNYSDKEDKIYSAFAEDKASPSNPISRFPANLIHDNSEEVRACFPDTKSGKAGVRKSDGFNNGVYGKGMGVKTGQANGEFGDSGNASRFFKSIIYQPKASKSERNRGCEGLEEKETKRYGDFEGTPEHAPKLNVKNTNNHPTVKPVALMQYLIKMVTPKRGVVLDPFAGSGTTGVACEEDGFGYVLIEMEEEHLEIINSRLGSFNHKTEEVKITKTQLTMNFDDE